MNWSQLPTGTAQTSAMINQSQSLYWLSSCLLELSANDLKGTILRSVGNSFPSYWLLQHASLTQANNLLQEHCRKTGVTFYEGLYFSHLVSFQFGRKLRYLSFPQKKNHVEKRPDLDLLNCFVSILTF